MKKLMGLVTFLLIELSSSEELRIYVKWEMNIYVPFHSTICDGMLLKPRLFIADGNCVNKALISESNRTYYDIYVNRGSGFTTYMRLAEVEKKNIFYNEDLAIEFDKSKRNVAVLITNQPLVSDNNRTLLKFLTQYVYDHVWNYNEQSQLVNLTDIQEIKYSNCIVPVSGRMNYFVDPCTVKPV
ncbi:GSCOCG00008383001-RA-CDS [Cotesia congregata]|uniref:Uncharacterized protein n=1 Tax=Cotesia congregata TaxID=51543 RepID=A0A8J2H396_COTCN|nr:GSCOCG00008383001-RA-CDS [Cotesia congregata]CAG5073983.1 Protein of unknown function [Cotesia congregata]